MFNGSQGFGIGDNARFNSVAGDMYQDTHHHYSGSGTVNHVRSVGNAVFGNNFGTINQGGAPPPPPRGGGRGGWYPPRGPGPRHQEPAPHMGPPYPDGGYWNGPRYSSGSPAPPQQYHQHRAPFAPPRQQPQQQQQGSQGPYGGPWAPGPNPQRQQYPQQMQQNSAYMMQQQFNTYHGPPQGHEAPYQEQYAGTPPRQSHSAPPAVAENHQWNENAAPAGHTRAFDEVFSDLLGNPNAHIEQGRPEHQPARSSQPQRQAGFSKRPVSQRATVETEDESSDDERRNSGPWVDEEMEDITQGVGQLDVSGRPSSSKRPPPVRKDSRKMGRTWYGKKRPSNV